MIIKNMVILSLYSSYKSSNEKGFSLIDKNLLKLKTLRKKKTFDVNEKLREKLWKYDDKSLDIQF